MNRTAVIAGARHAWRAAVLLAYGAGSGVVRAAEVPQFAVPGAQSATKPVIGTLRVTLAMCLVLGAVLAAGWFMRRMRGASSAGETGLRVLAQVSLGARERAVLLRVGARQILVGVAPGSVRTLHVLDATAAIATDSPAMEPRQHDPSRPSFKSLLLRSLGK
ncbi:MAG: flagellar biosynthetic protein FliO [Steroidobacteraceae bacterium]